MSDSTPVQIFKVYFLHDDIIAFLITQNFSVEQEIKNNEVQVPLYEQGTNVLTGYLDYFFTGKKTGDTRNRKGYGTFRLGVYSISVPHFASTDDSDGNPSVTNKIHTNGIIENDPLTGVFPTQLTFEFIKESRVYLAIVKVFAPNTPLF